MLICLSLLHEFDREDARSPGSSAPLISPSVDSLSSLFASTFSTPVGRIDTVTSPVGVDCHTLTMVGSLRCGSRRPRIILFIDGVRQVLMKNSGLDDLMHHYYRVLSHDAQFENDIPSIYASGLVAYVVCCGCVIRINL